jgi:hypothetical protein
LLTFFEPAPVAERPMLDVSPCPASPDLQRFLLGQTDEGEGLAVEQHLEQCADCRQTLQSLDAADRLVEDARWVPGVSTDPPGDLVAELIGRLSGVYDSSLAAGETPASGGTEELHDFLAPPQAEGELGRLGPYRILRVLGAGDMGVVFAAEDMSLQRPVALKVLRPSLAASASARRRFLREARAAAGLEHEHIVAILQTGEDRGLPSWPCRCCAARRLKTGCGETSGYRWRRCCGWGRRWLSVSRAAHDRGLIHRDIKPSNILLAKLGTEDSDTDSRVKIVDFGLARAFDGDAQLTQSGVIVGTPAYIAPEQARGEPVGPRADLFSLGCVLYRMCTGEVPFKGSNLMATLRSLELAQPRPPRAVNPDVPPALSRLIMQLLTKDPNGRPASARAVQAALEAINRAPDAAPDRRRWWLAGAILLGALGLADLITIRPGAGGTPGDSSGAPPVQALPVFTPAVAYTAGLYPAWVVVGDFNNDGNPDLAVANLQGHAVSVLPGKANGTFGPAITSPAGEWFATALTIGDFNGDGKLDLAVVNQGSHTVSVLLGKGDGTFAPPVRYAVGLTPGAVAVADFNGDGQLDLAVMHSQGISVLAGSGDGTFADAVAVNAGAGCHFVVAADINGDGRADLIAATDQGGGFTVLFGRGDGTFEAGGTYATGGARTLAVADLDGDGKLDVVVPQPDGLAVFLGKGDDAFREAATHSTGVRPMAVVAGDFDADGQPDLAVIVNGNIRLLPGNGDGTFRDAADYPIGEGAQWFLAAGDFNGDGALDLAAANFNANTVSVLLNRTAGRLTFGPPDNYPAGPEPVAVTVTDFNGDGQPDLAVVDGREDAVRILFGGRDGAFGAAAGPGVKVGKSPVAVAVGDFNRDGRPDLAVANRGGDSVSILLGRGDGSFESTVVSVKVGKGPVALAVGDFNHDGQPDLAVACCSLPARSTPQPLTATPARLPARQCKLTEARRAP